MLEFRFTYRISQPDKPSTPRQADVRVVQNNWNGTNASIGRSCNKKLFSYNGISRAFMSNRAKLKTSSHRNLMAISMSGRRMESVLAGRGKIKSQATSKQPLFGWPGFNLNWPITRGFCLIIFRSLETLSVSFERDFESREVRLIFEFETKDDAASVAENEFRFYKELTRIIPGPERHRFMLLFHLV